MIFCSSIHDRSEWAPVVPLLQAARAEPRWLKARLSSHDLAVRIVSLERGLNNDNANEVAGDVIRFVLIAPADVGKPDTNKRLQRLAQKKSCVGSAVLVLLSSGDADGYNMASYNQIQLDLRDTDLSVFPLTTVATLPATVAAFCSQFTMPSRTDTCTSPGATTINLLRMYLGGQVPLPLAGAKRLIAAAEEAAQCGPNGNTTLQDVIRFCSDLRSQNPQRLADLLGAEDAARLADL